MIGKLLANHTMHILKRDGLGTPSDQDGEGKANAAGLNTNLHSPQLVLY